MIKKKILLIFSVIIILLIIFGLFNIGIIINWSNIKELQSNEHLNTTCIEHDLSISLPKDIVTSTIKYKEIVFEHPFGNNLTDNNTEDRNLLMNFNGQDLRIQINYDKVGSRISMGLNDEAKKLISDIYGNNIMKSDFSLMNKAYELTLEDISLFKTSNKKLLANMWLLFLKLYYLPTNDTILQFETNNIQGFQYNVHRPKDYIVIEVYDANGKAENNYSIMILGDYSQKDIDIILSTMEFNN